MAIRAITFDFWQTLFRDVDADKRFLVREEAVVRLSGATPEAVRAALEGMHKEFFRTHLDEQRNLTPADGVRLVCAALDWEPSMAEAGELADIFAEAVLLVPPEPVADAVAAVAAAAARGPVGLISDVGLSPGRCLRVLLDQHGFTPHFTALTFSHEVGVSKPQAAMFEVTAAALGVSPSELLHIGDLEPTDIAGVRALGGVAGLFTGVHDKYRAQTRAEYVFPDWADFLARIDGILPGV
jgi:FMN phosphatase YigB (HAD superfamily)